MKALFDDDEDDIKNDVAETLWQEIAKEAGSVYKTNWFKDKTPVNRVSQKVRSPFRRMMNKLIDLSFVDNGIENVVSTIQEVLNNLPSSGYIEGHSFSELTNWLLVMSNEDTLRLHAEGKPQYSATPEPEVITHEDTDVASLFVSGKSSETASESSIILETADQENSFEFDRAPKEETVFFEPAERNNSLGDFGFNW